MESLLALTIGALAASGVYLMLRRNLLRFILGLALLTNAVNLVILAGGRVTRGHPPLIPAGEAGLAPPFANPLPQALILTAIVIGFGLLSYALVLLYRAHEELRTLDAEAMRAAEPEEGDPEVEP
ncbi:Na+/H+ antiporter subunit C [Thermus sediminis]|uniref:Na+/H+ antiporter subunit C n=1 Tax=Thermus sediminis TaxID=1761908 RepID=UPI000E3DA229|nr:Na+/H+ antiporter subunit C [Thermus sediminis]